MLNSHLICLGTHIGDTEQTRKFKQNAKFDMFMLYAHSSLGYLLADNLKKNSF